MNSPLHRLARAIIAAAALSLPATAAIAADWPQWRNTGQTGISKETGLLKIWSGEGPEKLWEYKIGQGYSCFAVVGGQVFTMGQFDNAQWAVCLDTATGKELWKIKMGAKYDNYPGPRSTPTVDGDKVYFIDSHGTLLCLNKADGSKVWEVNLLKATGSQNLTWAIASSPVVDGDKLIVPAGKSKGASFLALNKKDGKEIWKAAGGKGDIAGYSTPVIATIQGKKQYVAFPASGAQGIDADTGDILWQSTWKTTYDVNAATPIVEGNKVFIASGYNVGSTLLEIGADGAAKTLWKNKAIRAHFTTPILYKGTLYGFDDDQFASVDFATGKVNYTKSEYGKGTVTMADGLLYILGEHGNMALAKPNPKQFEKISEFNTGLGQERCWTAPVIANGKLFVRDEARMICYNIKQ